MTKMAKLMAVAAIVDKANEEIAFARGQLSRAYNRPKTGCLVPKFETDEQLAAFTRGWDAADGELAE